MLNLIIGLIFIVVGIDVFFHPVYQSYKCGGCEIDLRPFHYFIGPILVGLGSYLLFHLKNRKS